MRTVKVSWDKEAGRFTALGRHPGQQIAINAPAAPSEENRAPTGFSATELLLAGAGSCAAWDVVEILRKRRADVAALDVEVEGQQDADPPWTYRAVALHFRVNGVGLKVPVLARVVRLAIVRYCSVITTLAGVAAISATIELVEPDGSSTGRVRIELALPAVPLPPLLEPTADEDEDE
ncbi:MAG TPA: OsmC family protein [Candidatus Limnocylindrales bacterium]|jgi:putative redox protein